MKSQLLSVLFFSVFQVSSGSSSTTQIGSVCRGDVTDASQVLTDVQSALARSSGEVDKLDIRVPSKGPEDVLEAIKDVTHDEEKGRDSWNFLCGLSGSNAFVKKFWHKQPLVLRSEDCKHWAKGLFTVEKDLRLVDNSYITGFKTAEILRNGTKTDTWALSPLKEDPSRKTLWQDVESALDGGTIYFNTAGGLWKNLGGLCRLTSLAFGLPPNVNVYVTPPGTTLLSGRLDYTEELLTLFAQVVVSVFHPIPTSRMCLSSRHREPSDGAFLPLQHARQERILLLVVRLAMFYPSKKWANR